MMYLQEDYIWLIRINLIEKKRNTVISGNS